MAKKVPKGRASRTARVGSLAIGQGLRWNVGGLADRIRSEEGAREASGERALALADALVDQLGTMKGAAMKLGQVLSGIEWAGIPEDSRSEFQAKLARLRDDVEPQPWSVIEKVIRQDLGGQPSRIFRDIEQEAFAAASIGQVHRAWTAEGDLIALKVQYPGVREAVESDMRNLGLLSPMIRKLAPGLDVKPLFGELRERIGEELDYELEAERTRILWRLLRGHPLFSIPKPWSEYSGPRVLATGFIEGQSFQDLKASSQKERNQAGETLFRFYFGLLNHAGWALGDPHPGNMIRTPGGMGFLDFGMIRQVSRDYLDGEGEIARAVIEGDALRVHDCMTKMGYLSNPEQVRPEGMLEQLEAAGGWYFQPGRLKITPSLVADIVLLSSSTRSPYYEQMRHQSIPPTSLLIRRMEGMVLSALGELEAEADWGSITREFVLDRPPSTPLGEIDQAWWRTRS